VWGVGKITVYTVIMVLARCGPNPKHRGKGVGCLALPYPVVTVYTSTMCAVARRRVERRGVYEQRGPAAARCAVG
jgi:hypothetical protein